MPDLGIERIISAQRYGYSLEHAARLEIKWRKPQKNSMVSAVSENR